MHTPFYCPHCKSLDIIEYPTTIECPRCNLEFDKRMIGVVPDDEILAIGEMNAFFEGFEDLKDPKTLKRIFRSLMDDLEDDC